LLLCVSLISASAQFLDSAPQSDAGGVAIRLNPSHLQNGLPLVFEVVLTNISGHDLRLPQPQLECANSMNGFIFLRASFLPADASMHPTSHGCAVDSFSRNTLERAKSWQTLASGASLSYEFRLQDAVPDAPAAGRYTVWADFTPAAVSPDEIQMLHQNGIDVPTATVTTVPVHYEISQPH
jgi:hypothetical protein